MPFVLFVAHSFRFLSLRPEGCEGTAKPLRSGLKKAVLDGLVGMVLLGAVAFALIVVLPRLDLGRTPGKKASKEEGSSKAKVWNLKGGKEALTLRGHSDKVMCLAMSADGKWLFSGSSDNTIKVWDYYDFRPHLAGKEIYIETILQNDDPKDPTIQIVSIHDA